MLTLIKTRKLIHTGWTDLVELRGSSCKLFVSGCLGFWLLVHGQALPCSCCSIYTHNTVPSDGWRSEALPRWCYIKCVKSTKPVQLVMASLGLCLFSGLSKYLFQVYLEVLHALWLGVTVLMPWHFYAQY